MRAVIFIVIAAILGSSLVGVGHMSGNQDTDYGDWYKKFWDYFDYKKYMGFMNSGGSDNDDKDDCDDRKKDHKEYYDGYKKYYDDNKNHFGKGDYKKHLDDYKKYFDNNRAGFDKTDFKQYMDYYKKYLDDNKKSFDKDDYDKYDKEYKKYSDEYPSHDDDCEDMDDNDDKTIIDHAIISFNINQRQLKDKDNDQIYFQNIVDQCIFESSDSFAPLCVKCKFLTMDGKTVLAKGAINFPDKKYDANEEIIILMSPAKWADPYTPVLNDVQDVDRVEITVCGFKDKCPDDDHDKCKCDDRKKDHKKHYDDFDKYYKDNKNKFGKDGHSKYMDDYEKYMNDEGKYMDKSDYKMFMDYHEKYLKDNKNSFSSSDYKKHSSEHEKHSKDYPNHHEKCECEGEKEDHKKHYDDFDKYYKDNKNKFGKDGHSKYMDDYEKYMSDEGKHMDKSECKMFDDYHGQFLKNNKNSFSSSDYKRHSEEHEKHSKDCENHDDDECDSPPPPPTSCPQTPLVTTDVDSSGNVKVTYMQSRNVNDNSYGINAIGWGTKGHTFKDLHNSDKLQFQFFKKSNGQVVLDFYMDYLTTKSSNPISGYDSLGPDGGDGSMVSGSRSNILLWSTSFAKNLNNYGYFAGGTQAVGLSTANLLIDSPPTIPNTSYTLPGSSPFPLWDFTNTYTITVSKNAFPGGFVAGGYDVKFPSIHNSPAKKCPSS